MIKNRICALLLVCITISCSMKNDPGDPDIWKEEILATEKAFAEMAAKDGIPKAFITYAANDAVLMRNDSLITGKESIQSFFNSMSPVSGQVSLSWEPDFVDVSHSGDLGYTYGSYLYTVTDSLGTVTTHTGIFHTVWKRQEDGTWRYVWD